MKILLSNDDGVHASGILASKEAVEEFGEVFVVAPSTQQSGIGHALTLYEPIRMDEVKLRDGSTAYSISGTPTDSVTMAIFEIMGEWPDLVISGINTGQNTGKGELSTSGTLGAAMEAASLGISAIAISQHVETEHIKFNEGHIGIDFSPSQRILKNLVKKIQDKGFPEGVDILNVNVIKNIDLHTFIVDTVVTALTLIGLNKQLTELDNISKRLHTVSDKLTQDIGEGSINAAQKIQTAQIKYTLAKAELKQDIEESEIEVRNQAETMVYETEKNLKEYGDKLPADKKGDVETALGKLKDAHKSGDITAIDAAINEFNSVMQAASQQMYQGAGSQPGADQGFQGGQQTQSDSQTSADDVQDADFEEVK